MRLIPVDPDTVPEATGGYVNAMLVDGASRLLFISGQIPQMTGDQVPGTIEEQCRLVWRNLAATLDAAGLEVGNLVKVTTFLGDRGHAGVSTAVRREVLGDHRPALTVIVTEIWDPAWLIEIEAIAAA